MALDPFKGKRKGGIPESVIAHSEDHDEEAKKAKKNFETYYDFLTTDYSVAKEMMDLIGPQPTSSENPIGKLDLEILRPAGIQIFMEMLNDLAFNPPAGKNTLYMGSMNGSEGFILSRLMQQSYDNGYNGFLIDTKGRPLQNAGSYLKGNRQNPARAEIHALDVFLSANNCRHANIDVHANAKASGRENYGATITIFGSSDNTLGLSSKYSSFQADELKISDKSITQDLGRKSKHCSFDIRNKAGFVVLENPWFNTYSFKGSLEGLIQLNAIGCTFLAANEQIYNAIRRDVGFISQYVLQNKIEMIK